MCANSGRIWRQRALEAMMIRCSEMRTDETRRDVVAPSAGMSPSASLRTDVRSRPSVSDADGAGVVPSLDEAFKVTGNWMTRHESSHKGHHAAPT